MQWAFKAFISEKKNEPGDRTSSQMKNLRWREREVQETLFLEGVKRSSHPSSRHFTNTSLLPAEAVGAEDSPTT